MGKIKSQIAAARAAATPEASSGPSAAAPRQDVSESSPTARSTQQAEPPSTSGGPQEGQAVPYERFKQVNDEARSAKERLAQIEAEKEALAQKLAAEERKKAAAKADELAERLRRGDIDESTLPGAIEAIVDAKLESVNSRITAQAEEAALRVQLGTLPPEAQDAVLAMHGKLKGSGLSLEEVAAIVRQRSPSLFPEANYSPAQFPTFPGGRVQPQAANKNRNWQLEMAQAQGKTAKEAVGREWLRSLRK